MSVETHVTSPPAQSADPQWWGGQDDRPPAPAIAYWRWPEAVGRSNPQGGDGRSQRVVRRLDDTVQRRARYPPLPPIDWALAPRKKLSPTVARGAFMLCC